MSRRMVATALLAVGIVGMGAALLVHRFLVAKETEPTPIKAAARDLLPFQVPPDQL